MAGMEGLMQSKSKTFLTFCFCFLAGILAGSLYNRSASMAAMWIAVISFISWAVIFRRHPRATFVLLGASFLFLGFARYTTALPTPLSTSEKETVFNAYVAAEPDVRQDGVRYVVRPIDGIELESRHRIYLKTQLYPRYEYGDVLYIGCLLQKPEAFEGFRYDMYLLSKGVSLVCDFPRVEKADGEAGSRVLRGLYGVKYQIADQVHRLWHEPYAGFMAGLLYGYRGGLGRLQEEFQRTGVTHIIAISGYNMTIIASMLTTFCISLWIPRKKAFWLVTFGLGVFVVFVGLSGSVVRAGIMGFLVIFAKQLGRVSRIGNAMAMSAVLMTWANPFLLAWDAGFQLSFLATIGLIYVAPLFDFRLEKYVPPVWLREPLAATLSAMILTLPLILFQFGRLSIVAPVVNLLVLPFIPWLMMGGFVSVAMSFLFYPLGQAAAWVTWILMRILVGIVEIFAGFSFASVEARLPIWAMLLSYGVLAFWLKNIHRRQNYQLKLSSSQEILPPARS